MKKIALMAIFVNLLVGAQQVSAQDLRLGFRGGFNLSTFVGEDADDLNLKPGFHVGPYIKYGVNDMFFFQPELLLSTKGYTDKGSFSIFFNEYNWKVKQSMMYLDLPMMGGVNITENFNFLLGIQPSFLLGAKYKIDYEENPYKDDDEDDNANDFAGVDFGLVTGLGLQLDSGLDVGFRFNYGFVNVLDSDKLQAHNLNLLFTVGYSIGK